MGVFRIEPTNGAPLEFEGDIAARSEGGGEADRKQSRWYDIVLYRTNDGQYILQVDYHTLWKGEHACCWAEPVAIDEVAGKLEMYDPCNAAEIFSPNREQELEWLRRRYELQVMNLLKQIENLQNGS